jgi:hypothetical protein
VRLTGSEDDGVGSCARTHTPIDGIRNHVFCGGGGLTKCRVSGRCGRRRKAREKYT